MPGVVEAPDQPASSPRFLDQFVRSRTPIWLSQVLKTKFDENISLEDLFANCWVLGRVAEFGQALISNQTYQTPRQQQHLTERPYRAIINDIERFHALCETLNINHESRITLADAEQRRSGVLIGLCLWHIGDALRERGFSSQVPNFAPAEEHVKLRKSMPREANRERVEQFNKSASSSPVKLPPKENAAAYYSVTTEMVAEAASALINQASSTTSTNTAPITTNNNDQTGPSSSSPSSQPSSSRPDSSLSNHSQTSSLASARSESNKTATTFNSPDNNNITILEEEQEEGLETPEDKIIGRDTISNTSSGQDVAVISNNDNNNNEPLSLNNWLDKKPSGLSYRQDYESPSCINVGANKNQNPPTAAAIIRKPDYVREEFETPAPDELDFDGHIDNTTTNNTTSAVPPNLNDNLNSNSSGAAGLDVLQSILSPQRSKPSHCHVLNAILHAGPDYTNDDDSNTNDDIIVENREINHFDKDNKIDNNDTTDNKRGGMKRIIVAGIGGGQTESDREHNNSNSLNSARYVHKISNTRKTEDGGSSSSSVNSGWTSPLVMLAAGAVVLIAAAVGRGNRNKDKNNTQRGYLYPPPAAAQSQRDGRNNSNRHQGRW